MLMSNIPMAKRLLDRQASLIHHLTSVGAIFGGERNRVLDQALHGIDPNLLRLEARFSHDKRMEKIAAVFPRTLALMGADREAAVAAFTAAHPPTDISRIENARQFHGFVVASWPGMPSAPPYLADVAAFEFACASARAANDTPAASERPLAGFRRRAGVVLLRTGYDLRSILEDRAADLPPSRDCRLAIAVPANGNKPMIFDLTIEVYDLLSALDHWTDPAAFIDLEARSLIDDLASAGLVEFAR